MARYDWYILRIWRSGRLSGEQWAARLDAMPEGESRRFNEPDLLLEHLRAVIVSTGAGATCLPPEGGWDGEPDTHKNEGE